MARAKPTKMQKAAIDNLGMTLVAELSPQQRRFCELYASYEEFFGNGTQSYIEAYNPKRVGNWYKSAMASASRLLGNVKISDYINHLLELRGLNDTFVDKQLEFLITQHADFKSKLGGIHEYNQLKKRTEGGGNKTMILILPAEIMKKNNIPVADIEVQ